MFENFLRQCFLKAAKRRENSAFASMLGACNNGHDIIGGRQNYASYVRATADQVILTSPQDQNFNELIGKLNQRLNGYADNFSPFDAIVLSQEMLSRSSDHWFLSRFRNSYSVQTLKEELMFFIAEQIPKIKLGELNSNGKYLYLYGVIKNTEDNLKNRKDPKSQELLNSIGHVSQKLAKIIVDININEPRADKI